MSVALRKADGDLFIDTETGRGELVSGPTKVSQELFSLYATKYDPARNWGTDLEVGNLTFSSEGHFRSILYARVNQANDRMLQKQASDTFLNTDTELVREFSQLNIIVDAESSAGFFFVTAIVGDENTAVGKSLSLSFKPVSLRHVVPPPFPAGLEFFK